MFEMPLSTKYGHLGKCITQKASWFVSLWLSSTIYMYSAAQCCGPYDSKLGRKGYYPPLAGCSVYGKDNPYDQKCEPKNSTGTTKAEL